MKVFLSSAFLCMSVIVNAQFANGDKYIGGTFSISLSKQNSPGAKINYTSCGAQPTFGFFLNDKFAVGGAIGYVYSRQKIDYNQGSIERIVTRDIRISAIVGRYFMISENFFFRISGDLNYRRGTRVVDGITAESKNNDYRIGVDIRPAMIFFPSPKWGIEASIGDLSIYHSRDLSNDVKNTGVSLDYGTFSLGFAYYMRKQVE